MNEWIKIYEKNRAITLYSHVETMWSFSVDSKITILSHLGMTHYKQISWILGEIRIVRLTKHERQ